MFTEKRSIPFANLALILLTLLLSMLAYSQISYADESSHLEIETDQAAVCHRTPYIRDWIESKFRIRCDRLMPNDLKNVTEDLIFISTINFFQPDDFRFLSSIEFIQINAPIQAISSQTFSDLRNLKLLRFHSHKLSVIESFTFKNLNQLRYFNFQGTPVHLRPNALAGLNSLQTFFVALKDVNRDTFLDIPTVTNLGIHIDSKVLTARTFESLRKLEELGVFGTPTPALGRRSGLLKRIEPDAFRGMEKLKKLELWIDFSSPESISWRSFDVLHGLKEFNLVGNNLDNLRPSDLDFARKTNKISIASYDGDPVNKDIITQLESFGLICTGSVRNVSCTRRTH